MSDAFSAFGDTSSGFEWTEAGKIVLPDTPQVTAADVGAVWMDGGRGDTKLDSAITVAVTFPKQGMIIMYSAPVPADPDGYIQAAAKSERINGAQLVWLGSVPAWTIPARSDGLSWGMIQFIVAGAKIQVDGHTDVASLQAVAQSIVDRATTSG